MRVLTIILVIISSILCLFVLIYGIVLYFHQFSGSFSNLQAVWGAFGDYTNMLISFVNLIILSWIGIISYRTTNRFNQVQLRPQLFMSTDFREADHNMDSWFIRNAFEAPAINVFIRFTMDIKQKKYTKWTTCFSVGRDQYKEMDWIRFPDEIQVVWTDIIYRHFYKMSYSNWNGQHTRIGKKEYELARKKASTENKGYTTNILSRNFKNNFKIKKLDRDEYLKFLQGNNQM
jgi:hypothetical protein